MRIDPLNLQEYEKDHLDEIIGMFLSVTVHSSHHLAVSNTYCQLHHIYFYTPHQLKSERCRCKVKHQCCIIPLKYFFPQKTIGNLSVFSFYNFI